MKIDDSGTVEVVMKINVEKKSKGRKTKEIHKMSSLSIVTWNWLV